MGLKKRSIYLKYKILIIIFFTFLTNCGKLQRNENYNPSFIAENNESSSKIESSALKWTLPELSIAEKETIIDSVKTIFNDLYVHRLQKIIDYQFDSLKEANQLNINMSSEELLRKTMFIFMNIRDLHTDFEYPLPAKCLIRGFPLNVNLSYDLNGLNEKLIISEKLTDNPKFENDMDNLNYNDLKLNDEILTISNLGIEGFTAEEISVKDAINELGKYMRGANEDAFKTRAVQSFFSRNGAFMKTPEGRFTIKVQKTDGTIKKYSFPWITKKSRLDICNENKRNDYNNNLDFFKLKKSNKHETISNYYKNIKKKSNDNVTLKIVKKNDKKYGLIRIEMFIPSANFDENDYLSVRNKIFKEVNFIRNFISKNKDILSGIIFDVRDNGGGFGVYPILLANIFTHQFVTNMKVFPLVSPTNRDTFYNLEMSRYFSRLGTNDELSEPILNTVIDMDFLINDKFKKELVNKRLLLLEPGNRFDGDENDALPQNFSKDETEILEPIYTEKPVAVLTNSNCYSSCDDFAALFKDYKIARIFGETRHTGGGGANVIDWKEFLTPVIIDSDGTKSSIIPNAKSLPKGIELRFAWNKVKRLNTNKDEQYIEGNGVISDYIYKPTSYDILNNGENILNKIMDDMGNEKNPKKFYLNR